MIFNIYILYSPASDIYYVGYTNNYFRRLEEHNHQEHFNSFTSKHRPWKLKAVFKCCGNEANAIRVERFIKKQKSRKLIETLCEPGFIPEGYLAQLVRVPDIRD